MDTGLDELSQLLVGEALDPEEVVEFAHWLKEEDLVFEILGQMLSVRIADYPLLVQELESVLAR